MKKMYITPVTTEKTVDIENIAQGPAISNMTMEDMPEGVEAEGKIFKKIDLWADDE